MFNPAEASEKIKREFIGYIATTFHFKDARLQQNLLRQLECTVSKGPFIEIKDIFKSGKSINDLIAEGVLSSLFKYLEKNKKYSPKLPVDRPLYAHQEKAVRKIVDGKNVVVSTGTGSGKTNCFIIPIINSLLKEKEQGTLNNGVRAMFIYPMNALANDQIKILREILMAYPEITFGVYNGGTENKEEDAIKLYETMFANERPELRKRLPNEMLSRDEMKRKPPHILFTNYAMLEHMLFRPGDDVLFSKANFKYVVLDEAHVYAGATGIETSLLMNRLKGRIETTAQTQFILTSATLGNQTKESNEKTIEFAENLTGCKFYEEDIVFGVRDTYTAPKNLKSYEISLYRNLADERNIVKDVLKEHGLPTTSSLSDADEVEKELIYNFLFDSELYADMREFAQKHNGLIELESFAKALKLTIKDATDFIALCARARKDGKSLVDARYHFFIRALDGCFAALSYPDSLSLIRRDYFTDGKNNEKMFEIAVCEDCGEIAIVAKDNQGKLERVSQFDEAIYIQLSNHDSEDEFDDETEEAETTPQQTVKKNTEEYVLCKNCGAFVSKEDAHNKWCTCGDTKQVSVLKLKKDKCFNCNGDLRRLLLGFDSATSVLATALYEQIPEVSFSNGTTAVSVDAASSTNRFLKSVAKTTKTSQPTGSQFLVFSDSRQGAAKFACHLEDTYKEFLRRKGIWNVIRTDLTNHKDGIRLNDFIKLLENYYSSKKLFRESNSPNAASSAVEAKRNAWVAILNELFRYNRGTSFVSLGKISFEYLGNEAIIDDIVNEYKLDKNNIRSFLNYLAFEIVKTGAVITDSESDINQTDRKYLFFTQVQGSITKIKEPSIKYSKHFMPTTKQNKAGKKVYCRCDKLRKTKEFLGVNDEDAEKFLSEYWGYLESNENPYHLESSNGREFYLPARHFKIYFADDSLLWKCARCGKVTQFNLDGHCVQNNCGGKLERLNSDEYCKNNYYFQLYENARIAPLFVKEHTAQLAKKEALDYQQQFIRKEINALSCSTTFEMGVDVGGLETVFLRNIPPMPSNYAQRVGRAGRSVDAAAFALTYARLSSHDFTFFDRPKDMIQGTIYPPLFKLENEKIIRRHIYAIALSLYLRGNPDLYHGNNAGKFLDGGYKNFIDWIMSKPNDLKVLLVKSIPLQIQMEKSLLNIDLDTFTWIDDFCGENGVLTKAIREYENNVKYLEDQLAKARREKDDTAAFQLGKKLTRYKDKELIDFLVRNNILPKYGFPVDSVELAQNLSSNNFKSLNLNRDLSIAIAEYAPSSEIIADGKMYTSRYIKKPVVNKKSRSEFDYAYIAKCSNKICQNFNYSSMPIVDNKPCFVCGTELKKRDFHKSIEPRSGFTAEQEIKDVPLTGQEKNYRTEAVYIGDPTAHPIEEYEFKLGQVNVKIKSTANDSLVVKSTSEFYVCHKCGYAISDDEHSKLSKYADYCKDATKIVNGTKHKEPFGKECDNLELEKFTLHHEFKTDVAKITFECNTTDLNTMLSVTYALLNAVSRNLNIERRDIKACLTYKMINGKIEHEIIIYDDVPGGAGHSRRLVTKNGEVLKAIIADAIRSLSSCGCNPSCYKCIRSYENQKIHELLDREKALEFLKQLQQNS